MNRNEIAEAEILSFHASDLFAAFFSVVEAGTVQGQLIPDAIGWRGAIHGSVLQRLTCCSIIITTADKQDRPSRPR